MNDQQKAKFLFGQMISVASKNKSHNTAAADFHAMSFAKKIDYMNSNVFPAYEAAGSPAPRTKDCLNFTTNYFNF